MSSVPYVNSNELGSSLFEPDELLSAQYYERNKKKIETTPETALVLAVLEDAIDCFQKHLLARDGRGETLFKETEAWILDNDEKNVFSFKNVCAILGIDADYLRLGLLRWKEKRLAFLVSKVKKKNHMRRG